MVRETLSKEMTLELGSKCYKEASYSKALVKRHLGRVQSKSKGPEADMKLVNRRNSQIASLLRVQCVGSTVWQR